MATDTLQIACPEYYAEVLAAADRAGRRPLLERALERLRAYAPDTVTRCTLYKDFAPLSFGVVMERQQRVAYQRDAFCPWFVGGLIYQGPDVPADGSFPSLTVSLDPHQVGWFLHT